MIAGDRRERFINAEMVHDGMAWRYTKYHRPGEVAAAEADAREHRRGLWVDPNPVPPWGVETSKTAGVGVRSLILLASGRAVAHAGRQGAYSTAEPAIVSGMN
jgi:hypothetical protein